MSYVQFLKNAGIARLSKLASDSLGIVGLNGAKVPFANTFDPRSFAHIGDSRTAALDESSAMVGYKTQRHFFHVANALNGQNMKMAGNFGYSGYRTDQFLALNLAAAMATSAGWLVFGSPAVNDIGQSSATPYTNVNGVSVTVSNVAAVAAGNITAAALLALKSGKRVIICSETGTTNYTLPGQVAATFELNQRLREFCERTPGCFYFDMTPIVWNATASTTAIAFRSGYLFDGVHFANLGGYYVGKAFAAFISRFVPPNNQGCASIADNVATNPLSLMTNPLFNTLTGGAVNGGLVLSSGNVPSGLSLAAAATTSVAITSAPEANGIGNAVTFSVTGTAADTMTMIFTAPSNNWWALTDILQGGVHMDVAAGSSNASIYWGTQINTDKGTLEMYDMYSARTGINYGPGPSEAYSYDLASTPSGVIAGSVVKGYVVGRMTVLLHGAGNVTFTLSRNWLRRRFSV